MSDADATAPRATGAPGSEDVFGIGKPLGEVLRDFRLAAKLGRGGMGIVYKAHQLSLDQDVALKILDPHLAQNKAFVSRFYREARMSVQLKGNANIVHGVAVGFACAICGYNGRPEEHTAHVGAAGMEEERGVHYFAMEFVEGENLAEWLVRLGRLSVGDALRITIDVAQALDYAHALRNPIFHRDVKPANIMITPTGEVKVADLGLAKAAEEVDGPTKIGDGGAGTPMYMPPEQAHGAALADGRSDIYALGVTLYVMLTGQKPFRGETMIAIVQAQERGKFEPASSINPKIPAAVDRVLSKMLAPDPRMRYQAAGQVSAALLETALASKCLTFLESDATPTAPPEPPVTLPIPTPRRWLPWSIGGVAAVLLLGALYEVGGLRVGFPRPQPGPPATRAQPNGEPVDLVLSRAMEQVASGNVNVARGTLLRWLTEHAGDPRIERPLLELERGVLILFQHQTPDMTSPYSPIWASDGIALTGRHNFRFGVASASECHVYVYQTDTRPSVTLVFPNPRYSPLANPIPPGTVLWLPGDPKKPRPTWLHLDTATGEQAIYFVAVKSPLRDPAGLGRQLIDHPMTDSLDSMLRGYTADGRPADSCFAAAAPVQVFRFRHEREKPAPPGKITVGSRGPSSSFAPMG